MDNKTLCDVTSYIDFLQENGFSLTLSCFCKALRPFYSTLLMYEPHLCRVCLHLKSSDETREKCIANKDRLNKSNPQEAYYYCCWAGVEEFVFPVFCDGAPVCCINLSGYRGRLDISEKLHQKLKKRLGDGYSENYDALSDTVPTQSEVERAINPLKYMLRSLYRQALLTPHQNDPADKVYVKTLRHLHDHYMEHISAEDIAAALCYSSSHLRHVFMKKSGKTISETLTDIRLSAAEQQLSQSELSVTQIALDCGFCDGNYFSAVFKKHKGISPKDFRAAAKKKRSTRSF